MAVLFILQLCNTGIWSYKICHLAYR